MGITGVVRVASVPQALPANSSQGFVVRCPVGKVALGGGYSVFPDVGVDMLQSRPVEGPSPFDTRTDPGWLVSAHNRSATDTAVGVSVVCASVD
ncbi:MAG: hypothetical protein ACRDZ7_17300 [Acidimicrobiia bacterium]